MDVLVEHTRKRVPAIAATSSGSTYSTIEFSKYAEKIGADCVMVTAPRPRLFRAGNHQLLQPAVRFAEDPGHAAGCGLHWRRLPAKVFVDLAHNIRISVLPNSRSSAGTKVSRDC